VAGTAAVRSARRLYLHGLSSGDFVPALEQFLGSSVGLSPAPVTRLTGQGQADHKAFGERDLSATDYVYVWADGIHLRIRLSEAKSCVLVVMGVRADGTKELIAMADGYRESAESWSDLLRDCPGPLARGERTPPRRARPGRSPLRTRTPRRTPRDLRGMTDLNHPHGIDNYLLEGPRMPERGVASLACSYRSAMRSR
jgi:hypothetical protein